MVPSTCNPRDCRREHELMLIHCLCVSTCNRVDELKKCILLAMAQTRRPVEVADASPGWEQNRDAIAPLIREAGASTRRDNLRAAALLCVCEGEEAIARDSARYLLLSLKPFEVDFYIVDDGSPSDVGESVAALCREQGCETSVTKLSHSLGYRGNGQRIFIGLSMIADSGIEYDIIIKLDPDTLVVREDLGRSLAEHCVGGTGIWGITYPMRVRGRVPLLADLIPFGFRRKRDGQQIQRRWELRRLYPVWWWRFGVKAFLNGFRFRFAGGPFYVITGRTLRTMHEQGFLRADHRYRHGLFFQEDIIASMASFACGHGLHDFPDIESRWGEPMINQSEDAYTILARRHFFLHPLKNDPASNALRKAVIEKAWGLEVV